MLAGLPRSSAEIEIEPMSGLSSEYKINFLVLCFSTLGIVVFFCIFSTLYVYPLFPFKMHDLEWTGAWLLTTVLDYYGSTLSLSAVVAFTEPPFYAVIWILLFNILGSPFCCMYIVYRYIELIY
jgi:hypothetical protein